MDQDQKSGLKGVVGVVAVAENPPADAEDHRAMPFHQGFQSVVVVLVEELSQQLPIAQAVAGR